MATNDTLQQYLAAFSAPGANIDVPGFEQQYLPEPPPAPEAITNSDPYGQALATFGAGLAQPIGLGQTGIGNAANAALGGLDVLNADRAAQNAAQQQQFENEISRGEQLGSQGQTIINAENANSQREYYGGLLKQGGMGAYADALKAGDDRVIEWAKISQKLISDMLVNVDPDIIAQLDPSFGMGLFQDSMDMFVQNKDLPTITAHLQQRATQLTEAARIADEDRKWGAFTTEFPQFAAPQFKAEFLADPQAFVEAHAAEIQVVQEGRAAQEAEKTSFMEWLMGNVFNDKKQDMDTSTTSDTSASPPLDKGPRGTSSAPARTDIKSPAELTQELVDKIMAPHERTDVPGVPARPEGFNRGLR